MIYQVNGVAIVTPDNTEKEVNQQVWAENEDDAKVSALIMSEAYLNFIEWKEEPKVIVLSDDAGVSYDGIPPVFEDAAYHQFYPFEEL